MSDESLTQSAMLEALRDLMGNPVPTIAAYCAASAEYVRNASLLTEGARKATQIELSRGLGRVLASDLQAQVDLPNIVVGERRIGGGLRPAQADVSESDAVDGVRLAVELKPVHLAVGRAIWNRFGDIRTFAVNVHLKFPFAVVGGVMTLPTRERSASNRDVGWKDTTHLITRAIDRFIRAGGRQREAEAPHLLEGIAVVVFDHETGLLVPDVPPAGSGLRWNEFIEALAASYHARFGVV